MHHLIRFIGILLLLGWGAASAQSRLPACPATTGYFHYCVGTGAYANGDKYVGEFKDNKPNGQGTKTQADGDKYVGEWKNGKYDGGTYTFANGDKYVGEFNGVGFNGQGTYAWANGNQYVGEWKDGKQNGQGTYTKADGGKYVGEHKDGKWDGQGTFTSASGLGTAGIWADDKFVRSAPVQQQPSNTMPVLSNAVNDAKSISDKVKRFEELLKKAATAEDKSVNKNIPTTHLEKFEAQKRVEKLKQMVEDDSRDLEKLKKKNADDLIIANGYFLGCFEKTAGSNDHEGIAFYNGNIYSFVYAGYNSGWRDIDKLGSYDPKSSGPWSMRTIFGIQEFYPNTNTLLLIRTNWEAGVEKFSYSKYQCYPFAGKKNY